ncbi:hypothetical protein [Burkholderia ubonensis]|uniref:hypothetical protein n=1 Tax=Burkholderia ubonensis TaxID=101571 RepID=UPI00076D7925|nr:hypothetical protein [Burkholderia ubonensis]KVN48414.1 hypothetical protein WJ64_21570 [Burkholderia ubonensis]
MLTLNDPELEGFTQSECDLLNQAVTVLMARGFGEVAAGDIAVNNWSLLSTNTVESLTRRNWRPHMEVKYEDIPNKELEVLVEAGFRHYRFLGLSKPNGQIEADQVNADRIAYPHLWTRKATGTGYVDDEKTVEFLVAVTGLRREICQAWYDA